MEFKHLPVMLNECLNGLNIKPNGIYVDGTIGGAGHSSDILKQLTTGLLIGIDKDDDALNASREKLSSISSNFKLVKSDFKNIKSVLENLNIKSVDGILLDLGVSSYQLDNAERGFSYMHNANLDMRMDRTSSLTAKKIVNEYSKKDLLRIFYEYGEEKFSNSIANNIIKQREITPITTTFELVDIIKKSVPLAVQHKKGHPAKRIFQAIRIEVNKELTGLEKVINEMVEMLNVGGRLAVISFHSLEDRIIKNAFKLLSTNCVCPKEVPICMCNHKAQIKLITKKPIIASADEQENNSRSLSAKLRISEKI